MLQFGIGTVGCFEKQIPIAEFNVRKSHETHPHLPPPTAPSFPLDFSQLLQAAVTNPTSKRKITAGRAGNVKSSSNRRADSLIEEVLSEDWDLVDDDV